MLDPLQKFQYRIGIEGLPEIGFSRASGLELETEVTEYREGGYPSTHKLPGLVKTGTITLEKGSIPTNDLYDLYREALTSGNRRTVTILHCDFAGQPVKQYVLDECWASKFTAPEFDGSSSEVAVETLELQYEDMRPEVL
jgi:phage tail-like protein